MEPKNNPSKAALFIVVNLIFCIEFAQGNFDTDLLKAHDVPSIPFNNSEMNDVYKKMEELYEEVGDGTCSTERIHQLRGTDCRLYYYYSNMEQLRHENITCSDVDWRVQCHAPLSFKECYTTQELNRLLKVFLDYLYFRIKEHGGNLAKFETCKKKVLSSRTESPLPETKNKAGSIVGIKMGSLIVLFFIVTYFGI